MRLFVALTLVALVGLSFAQEAAKQERTPLHVAASEGKLAEVQRLIDQGADVDARDSKLHTPLHDAAAKGHLEVVKLLLASGATLDAKCKSGDTPLFMAVEYQSWDAATLLVRKGANVNVMPPAIPQKPRKPGTVTWGGSHRRVALAPLHLAAKYRNLEIVKLLLEHGAKIDLRDSNGRTPLRWAGPRVAKLLIERGADVNVPDESGTTALDDASGSGDLATVELLIGAGANVNVKDENGATPLLGAVFRPEILKHLIEAGADINARDRDGWTALMRAARDRRMKKSVELLLSKGADVKAKENRGRTALHFAAEAHAVDVIQLLIDKGADINAEARDGTTPLYYALGSEHEGVRQWLVKHGATRGPATVARFEEANEEIIRKRVLHLRGRDAVAFLALDETWLVVAAFTGTDLLGPALEAGIDELVIWEINEPKGLARRVPLVKEFALRVPFAKGLAVFCPTEPGPLGKYRLMHEAALLIGKGGVDSPAVRKIVRQIVTFRTGSPHESELPPERVEVLIDELLGQVRRALRMPQKLPTRSQLLWHAVDAVKTGGRGPDPQTMAQIAAWAAKAGEIDIAATTILGAARWMTSMGAWGSPELRAARFDQILETMIAVLPRERAKEAIGKAGARVARMIPQAGGDYALASVAIAFAKLGCAAESMETAAKIKDTDRFVYACVGAADALRTAKQCDPAEDALNRARKAATTGKPQKPESLLVEIVAAYARLGNFDQARATTKLTKDPASRGHALSAIAKAQADAGDTAAALTTAAEIEFENAQDAAWRSIAVAWAGLGKTDEALALAKKIREDRFRAQARLGIVEALAQADKVNPALETAQAIKDTTARDSALQAVVEAQARLGEYGPAVGTANQISHKLGRRTNALAQVALALADAGMPRRAREEIQWAIKGARKIDSPGDRAVALHPALVVLARLGDADRALTLALQLEDEEARPELLQEIAAAQAEAGKLRAALGTVNSIQDAPMRALAWAMIAAKLPDRKD